MALFPIRKKEVLNVANTDNQRNKASVQSTELNKMPVVEETDTEFSAEEAAQAFRENQSAGQASEDRQ